MKKLLILTLAGLCLFARDYPKALSLYSNTEVREMASAYAAMVNRSENFDPTKNIDILIKSNEFRGYVIGTLESQEMLLKCAQSKSVQEIAYKTSLMITDAEPNSLEPSALTILMGINFACDDSMWTKKP